MTVASRATPALDAVAYVEPKAGAHHAFHATTGERLPDDL
jgi:hypothetical protein